MFGISFQDYGSCGYGLGVRVSVMDRVRVRVMVGVMVRVTAMAMVRDTPWSTGCGKDCGHERFC